MQIDLSYFNPFSKYFSKGKNEESYENDVQTSQNSQGLSEDEINFGRVNANADHNGANDVYVTPIHFSQVFDTKRSRIKKYREMEQYPEISEALDIICDESIVINTDGRILDLNFKKEIPKAIQRKIKDEFEYVINDVLRVRDRLWNLYRKFLVEGELFLEIVLNKDKTNVIGVKSLASFTTFPVYSGSVVIEYVQSIEGLSNNKKMSFDPNQIAYVNWGKNGNSQQDIRGFLDPAIRTYNQLKNLEDSIVVYRLSRASERRIWNIPTGNMPKGKAEAYIKSMIAKYKKQINYNTETGAIDSAQNVQAMTEDFWFSKGQDGQQTTVDTLPGGQSLGELSDVNYFLSKLYKVLKLPKSRFGDSGVNAQYSSGRNIEREEIKFGAFVERTQQRFEKLIMDILIQQLRIKKYDIKYIDRSAMDITFTKSNFFKDFKEQELIEANLNLWASVSSYVVSVNNPTGEFSREYVFKKILKWTDEQWNENETLRKKEQEEIKKVMMDQLNHQLDMDAISNDALAQQELDTNEKLGTTGINNTKETSNNG